MPTRAQVGSRGRRHERLDHAADEQHRDQAERDRARRTPLAGQGLGAGQRARLDPGPEQLEPDAGGHEHRGQLQQSVRQQQAPEVPAVVVADHDRAEDRDVRHVLEQQVDHREPEHARAPGRAPSTQALLTQTCAAK